MVDGAHRRTIASSYPVEQAAKNPFVPSSARVGPVIPFLARSAAVRPATDAEAACACRTDAPSGRNANSPRRGDAERVGGPARIQTQQHAGRRARAERSGGAGGVVSPRAQAGIRGPADARCDLVPGDGRQPAETVVRSCRGSVPGHRDRKRDRREVQSRREAMGVVEILRRGHESVVPGRAGDAAALRPREQHRASIAEEGQRSRARRRHVGPRPREARGQEVQEAEPGLVRHDVRDSGVGQVANRAGQVRGEGQGFGVGHVSWNEVRARAAAFAEDWKDVDGQVGSTHGELSHHATVLMLQNVAVIHIGISLGCRMIETHDNLRPVVVIQHHHILPASLIRRRRRTFHPLYQERATVHMKRMCARLERIRQRSQTPR